MASHNELGKFGEEMAVAFLQKNGYTILETNWVFQKAEIDIIAKKENILAIVEVKTRSSIDFGLPQDFVNPKKIQLLVKAVNEYVISNDIDVDVRFDIIAITKSVKPSISDIKKDKTSYVERLNFNIEHLVDAFYYF